MKTKKSNKTFVLNKSTVSDLDSVDMSKVKGGNEPGDTEISCPWESASCSTRVWTVCF